VSRMTGARAAVDAVAAGDHAHAITAFESVLLERLGIWMR
jgi:hypothetical protein